MKIPLGSAAEDVNGRPIGGGGADKALR